MTDKLLNHYKYLISTYICAKDENRPWFINKAFSPDASLEMEVATDNIAFPAQTNGRDAIAETLVRNFGKTYENVYTFCLENTVNTSPGHLSCDWVVCMTDKENRNVRVGWGRYYWRYKSCQGALLISKLRIEIQAMEIIPSSLTDDIFNSVTELAYPWVSSTEMEKSLSSIKPLGKLQQFLQDVDHNADAFDSYNNALMGNHYHLMFS